MQYVRDLTGRFTQRPHYDPLELDHDCESIVTTFLTKKYGSATFPVKTDDLVAMIEEETDDLDLYADLSSEPGEVQGVTDFFRGKKPRVQISKILTEDSHRKNRLRTTLAHEFGHVKFHNFLWQLDMVPPELPGMSANPSPRCNRDSILHAGEQDWMEWQAGYVSGALLIPKGQLAKLVGDYVSKRKIFLPVLDSSHDGTEIIAIVSASFEVSKDAARVRLLKLNHISAREMGGALL